MENIFDPPSSVETWSEFAQTRYQDFVKAACDIQRSLGNGIEVPPVLEKSIGAVEKAEKVLNSLMDQLRKEMPPRKPQSDFHSNRSPEEQSYEVFATTRSNLSYFRQFLEDNQMSDAHCLLLTGKPGEGKTHVLAEVTSRYGEEGGVALFFEGRIFDSARAPIETILAYSDFPSSSFRDFLAIIEALSARSGLPSFICIDALNETADRNYWKTNLILLADEISRFPGVRLIVSCRSDFAVNTIPVDIIDGSRSKWASVEHFGLGLNVVEALPKYFEEYRLKGFQIPPLANEFQTPLFLKIFCEAYEGRTPDADQSTLTTILRKYSQRKSDVIAEKIDCSSGQVLSALMQIAERMSQQGSGTLPIHDARSICETNFASVKSSESLLHALFTEGILAEIPSHQSSPLGTTASEVRFTYERVWDYYRSLDLLPSNTEPSGELMTFLGDQDWRIKNAGMLSMLAIRLPYEIGSELFEVLAEEQCDYFVEKALTESLDWRTRESWMEQTDRMLDAIVDGDEERLFEFLLKFSLNGRHPKNANFLHDYLERLPLAERDRRWTLWTNRVLVDDRDLAGLAELLAWSDDGDLKSIPDDTVLLMGITLSWLASTTSRVSRDRILDRLLRVLSGRESVAATLLERMVGVDDPYVVEAVLCACLGCCQKSHVDRESATRIAQLVFDRLVMVDQQPSNILLRFYASEILTRARSIGVSIRGDDSKLPIQWRSKPLKVWSEKSLNAKASIYERLDRAGGRISTLLDSLQPNTSGFGYGNFGRYVMEGRVERFLGIRLTKPAPRKVDYKHRFDVERAKRFIAQRVFQMGWDPEAVDLHPSGDYHLRDAEKTERLSKKYQWIGLHELIGRLSDHYHFTGWGDAVRMASSVADFSQYDIRESFVPDSLRDLKKPRWPILRSKHPWWLVHFDPLPLPLSIDAKRVFASELATANPSLFIEVGPDEDVQILLHGFSQWWEPRPMCANQHSFPRASIRWAFRSFLVESDKAEALVQRLSTKDLGYGQLWPDEPEFSDAAYSLQEYPEGQSDLAEASQLDRAHYAKYWNTGAFSTTCRFSPDADAENLFSGSIPSPKLAELGDLVWSENGLSFLRNSSGDEVVRHFGDYPKSACIAEKEFLLEVLLRNNLRIVWRCFGDKIVSNDRLYPGGRAYWMAFSMGSDGIVDQHSARSIRYPSDLHDEEPAEWLP
ncbi:hypothetical protein VSU19_22285 [Verrucomicrobiales bacterium BCK34]|nr:hypothetical protein [Verrucomicrobiales bacterium BCK34]